MGTSTGKDAKTERGSAMIVSVLVTAIMSLLGISYLLMADTENRIAENEKLAGQCLYFGEGTVREVKRWFDRPPYVVGGTLNLVKPLTTLVVRTSRQIDIDGDGPTAPVAADGTSTKPYYKVGIDRDLDGNDDIFDKPYRSALGDMLVGTETGPDIVIDRATSSATATFLDGLADKIAPNFPAAAAGVRARVKRIDIYEPPYLPVAGIWTRFGMGTVKATVEIVRIQGASTKVIATRIVKAVLNETPYPGPFGPLHSCQDLAWNGSFRVHWGPTTAVTAADPKGNTMPLSIPRDIPPRPQIDLLEGWQSPSQDAVWTTLKTALESNKQIEDPWWRLIVGGVNKDYAAVMTQQIVTPPSPTDVDRSNNFHRMDPLVGCPEFEYSTWKEIAKSNTSDVHYYTWDNGTKFRENGTGPATEMRALTDDRTGLFFFDTEDNAPPDPTGSNLTPEIELNGGTWGTRGFVYLNTSNFMTNGLDGRPIDMVWPGEPFRDKNANGEYDAGEDWINLNYSVITTVDPKASPKGAATDSYGGGVIRNTYGPAITGQTASLWGVLYISGTLDAQGNAWYYGSVITKGGMSNKMTGTPDMWWDPRLKDNWPPPGWSLPRVVISRWQTDL
jgi:hypothetical protein